MAHSAPQQPDRQPIEEVFLTRHANSNDIVTEICKTLRWLGIAAACCVCVYFLSVSFAALAGKQTGANVQVSVVVKGVMYLSLTAGVSGALLAHKYRTLWQKEREQMSRKIRELQQRLDPGRGSSK